VTLPAPEGDAYPKLLGLHLRLAVSYERRNGRWQIVWEQTTAIPNEPDLFLESLKPPT
jgi:hypothetical protein